VSRGRDEYNERELQMQGRVPPVLEVRGHRGTCGQQHSQRKQRAPAEAPRDCAQLLEVRTSPRDRDDSNRNDQLPSTKEAITSTWIQRTLSQKSVIYTVRRRRHQGDASFHRHVDQASCGVRVLRDEVDQLGVRCELIEQPPRDAAVERADDGLVLAYRVAIRAIA
jgi:hypothetical protein